MDRQDRKKLSEEEIQDIMHQYKMELSAIYRNTALQKDSIRRKRLSSAPVLLRRCDESMRKDILHLKEKYGIHY